MRKLGMEEWLDAWAVEPHEESLIALCDDVSDRLEQQEAQPDDVLSLRVADESRRLGERTPPLSRAVARLLFRVGMLREARGILIKALQRKKDAYSLTLMGQILVYLGDAKHGAQSFQLATKYRPNDPALRTWLEAAWAWKAIERDQGRDVVIAEARRWSASAPRLEVAPPLEEGAPDRLSAIDLSAAAAQAAIAAPERMGPDPDRDTLDDDSKPEFDLDALGLDGVDLVPSSPPGPHDSADGGKGPDGTFAPGRGPLHTVPLGSASGRQTQDSVDEVPTAVMRGPQAAAETAAEPTDTETKTRVMPKRAELEAANVPAASLAAKTTTGSRSVPAPADEEAYAPLRNSTKRPNPPFLRRYRWTLVGVVALLASVGFAASRWLDLEQLGLVAPARSDETGSDASSADASGSAATTATAPDGANEKETKEAEPPKDGDATGGADEGSEPDADAAGAEPSDDAGSDDAGSDDAGSDDAGSDDAGSDDAGAETGDASDASGSGPEKSTPPPPKSDVVWLGDPDGDLN